MAVLPRSASKRNVLSLAPGSWGSASAAEGRPPTPAPRSSLLGATHNQVRWGMKSWPFLHHRGHRPSPHQAEGAYGPCRAIQPSIYPTLLPAHPFMGVGPKQRLWAPINISASAPENLCYIKWKSKSDLPKPAK